MGLWGKTAIFSRRHSDDDGPDVGAGKPPGPGKLNSFFADVAEQAGRLNNEIVDVSGHVDGLAETVKSQALAFGELGGAAKVMREMLEAITKRAQNTNDSLGLTRNKVQASRSTAETGIAEVTRLVGAVQGMGQELNEFRSALQGVAEVAMKVGRIAQQTNLLALNATIEASRAGALGAGFAVVAREVKELARQASRDTRQISEAVERLSVQAERLLSHGSSTVNQAGTVQSGAAALGEVLNLVDNAMEGACVETSKIAEGAGTAGARVAEVQSALSTLADQVADSARSLEDTRSRVAGLIRVGESLVEITIASGAKTQDTPFVRQVVAVAAKISKAFDEAVAKGEIKLSDLLSRRLEPIAGTNPQQVLAPFTAFTDRVLPQFPGADAGLRRPHRVLRRRRRAGVSAHAQPQVLAHARARSDLERGQLPQPAHLQRSGRTGGRPQRAPLSGSDLPPRHGRGELRDDEGRVGADLRERQTLGRLAPGLQGLRARGCDISGHRLT
jgi:methyl-accepting chemotaxis protein